MHNDIRTLIRASKLFFWFLLGAGGLLLWIHLHHRWVLQYSRLPHLSVGPLSYSKDKNGKLVPLNICKYLYKKLNLEPLKQPFQIDTKLETGESRLIL